MVGSLDDVRLGIIGLGYVGLPLAVAFARSIDVAGFDIEEARIDELKQGVDLAREVPSEMLAAAKGLTFSADPEDLAGCNVYIVTVPTPIDGYKRPDLRPLEAASRTVGAEFLVLGLAFKANRPDLRNTGVVDIIDELKSYNARIHVHDPWVCKDATREENGLDLVDRPEDGRYDALILTVGHDVFEKAGSEGCVSFRAPASRSFRRDIAVSA